MTPLSYAAEAGNVECVRMLLAERPGMLDVQDALGRTALHIAAIERHTQVAALLMNAGARTDLVMNGNPHSTHGDETAAMIARRSWNMDPTNFLLDIINREPPGFIGRENMFEEGVFDSSQDALFAHMLAYVLSANHTPVATLTPRPPNSQTTRWPRWRVDFKFARAFPDTDASLIMIAACHGDVRTLRAILEVDVLRWLQQSLPDFPSDPIAFSDAFKVWQPLGDFDNSNKDDPQYHQYLHGAWLIAMLHGHLEAAQMLQHRPWGLCSEPMSLQANMTVQIAINSSVPSFLQMVLNTGCVAQELLDEGLRTAIDRADRITIGYKVQDSAHHLHRGRAWQLEGLRSPCHPPHTHFAPPPTAPTG